MTTQRKKQLERRVQGLCEKCGKPAARKPDGSYFVFCLEHMVKARERARRRVGCRSRWFGAPSYLASAEAMFDSLMKEELPA